jgi:hypothetical protein
MLSLPYSRSILFMIAFALLPAWRCAGAEPLPLAELLAAEATQAGLSVTVPTGGCTNKSDFSIASGPVSNAQASIEIRRLRADTCKGNFPEGVKLVFTWDDLKLPPQTKLAIKNPITPAFSQPGQVERVLSPVKHAHGASARRSVRSAQALKENQNRRHSHHRKKIRGHNVQKLAARHRHARWHNAARLCDPPHGARSCHDLVPWPITPKRPGRPACW